MKYKYLFFIILYSLILKSQIVSSSFDDDDLIYYENFGKPNDILLLDDGKFLISAKYSNEGVIYRLNANGTIDHDFGSNGRVLITESSFLVNDVKLVAVQSDGKILYNHIGANNYTSQNKFGRLNANGSIDNSFSSSWFGINSATYFYSPKLMPDGKIMATYYNGNGTGIVRYNSDGSLDTAFGLNGIYSISNTLYRFLDILNNDYILISNTMGGTIGIYTNGIVGNSNNINSNVVQSFIFNNYLHLINRGKISRLNANTSLDTTFGNNGNTIFNTLNIYGDTIPSFSGDILQLNLQDNQQKISLSSISSIGIYQGEYTTTINNLGNLQLGKVVKANSTNKIFYVLIAGAVPDKCALLRITDPTFTLNTKDANLSSKIKFYPNPFKQNIEFSNYVSNISIYDFSGRTVFTSSNSTKSLNIGFLEKGVYWLSGSDSDNKRFNEKLIKE